jgi:histidine kinase
MFGQPSLRRRLILSYLAVVVAVTLAGFVTVQVLVPQFFEQGVQQRLGRGPQFGQDQPDDAIDPSGPGPGPGPGSQTNSTAPDATSGPGPDTTSTPGPTGSTLGPGEPSTDPGQGDGNGNGQTGGNPEPGGGNQPDEPGNGPGESTSTGPSNDAWGGLAPGTVAGGEPIAAEVVERNPVPIEIQEEYDRALTGALVAATVIGLLIALVLGILFSRRLLKAFNSIKDGASRLANGQYDTRVAAPKEIELADLAESVNTLADSLQRTEQTRARLVSDLAHEIRNPLSTIEGYMEGLIDGVLPPDRQTYEAVAGEAHRLKKLTRDLSVLSKAQEGALDYAMEDADLAEIATGVVDTLRPQYEINEVKLDAVIPGPLSVHVDKDRIAQTLTNLLGNALAHTPPGGAVKVAGTAAAGRCRIAITDSGEGIRQTQLGLIFDRFTRLDSSQSGTGIGLNIARTLARAHGGDIAASSPGPGLGSTFELSLPMRDG